MRTPCTLPLDPPLWARQVFRADDKFLNHLFQIYGKSNGVKDKVMNVFRKEKEKPHLEYDMKNYDFHRSRWETGDWTDDSDQMILILLSLLDNDGKVSLHVFTSRAYIKY